MAVGLYADGDEQNAAYEKYWREQPKLKEREKQAKAAVEPEEKGNDDALQELVTMSMARLWAIFSFEKRQVLHAFACARV